MRRVFLLVELVLADSRARELAVRNLVRTSQPTKTGAQINNGRLVGIRFSLWGLAKNLGLFPHLFPRFALFPRLRLRSFWHWWPFPIELRLWSDPPGLGVAFPDRGQRQQSAAPCRWVLCASIGWKLSR